jgi:hypothetical protein
VRPGVFSPCCPPHILRGVSIPPHILRGVAIHSRRPPFLLNPTPSLPHSTPSNVISLLFQIHVLLAVHPIHSRRPPFLLPTTAILPHSIKTTPHLLPHTINCFLSLLGGVLPRPTKVRDTLCAQSYTNPSLHKGNLFGSGENEDWKNLPNKGAEPDKKGEGGGRGRVLNPAQLEGFPPVAFYVFHELCR